MFKDDSLAFKMFTNCPVELSIKKLFSLPKNKPSQEKTSENERMYS